MRSIYILGPEVGGGTGDGGSPPSLSHAPQSSTSAVDADSGTSVSFPLQNLTTASVQPHRDYAHEGQEKWVQRANGCDSRAEKKRTRGLYTTAKSYTENRVVLLTGAGHCFLEFFPAVWQEADWLLIAFTSWAFVKNHKKTRIDSSLRLRKKIMDTGIK